MQKVLSFSRFSKSHPHLMFFNHVFDDRRIIKRRRQEERTVGNFRRQSFDVAGAQFSCLRLVVDLLDENIVHLLRVIPVDRYQLQQMKSNQVYLVTHV